MTDLFKQLLAKRGLKRDFLYPKYEKLFDPFLMQGMETAVARIELARAKGEKIVIFGDYDVDGVTASAVLYEALEQFGCLEVEILLPNRFRDGYGMNERAIERILKTGAQLVITVDNGSGSGEVIAELKKAGIETIVTDHHEIPVLPEAAVAVVNPKRTDEKYGKNMAGVGVAFTLARALNASQNGGVCNGQEKWLLDLVVIGTICDSMLLRDENRIMSYFGMLVLSKTRRMGIKALAKVAGVNLAKIGAQAIGFQLGPRLNAAGRMEDADLALRLLMAKSRAEALKLATELEELNKKRREIQDQASKEIEMQYDAESAVVVVRGKWHEGVLGIIAGRVTEMYQKPAFALTELDGGVLKGSGRSFGDFSLAESLRQAREGLLLTGGGHALACGLSLQSENYAEFVEYVNERYRKLNLRDQTKYLEKNTDLVVKDFGEVDLELYEEICLLQPFGEGNVEPIFEIEAIVTGKRILKEKHLALTVADRAGRTLKMMAFFASAEWQEVRTGGRVKVQFCLTKNEWNGQSRLEASIISLKQL